MRDALMRSGVVEVAEVFLDRLVEVALTQDQEVQALTTQAAQEALADGIGLWCAALWPNAFGKRNQPRYNAQRA